ncbi:MAG: ATP-binding protein [Pseudomonadota bacterium]
MKKFIGRREELRDLEGLLKAPRPVLLTIKGRRRIGKSRLAAEIAKGKEFISFTGLAPVDGITAQAQLDAFARQYYTKFGLPPMTVTDWSDAFAHVTEQITAQPTIILFDEISWMGSKDPTFIPKLKVWWDQTLQQYPNIMLILCGSVSTWIEDNILNSTAFFGRISLQIDLKGLSLPESVKFLEELGVNYSVYDIFQCLAITGGVPWYLEQIKPDLTAEENIKKLCFNPKGVLVHEYDRIFHDLFDHKGEIYRKIVQQLGIGMKTVAELRQELDYAHGGVLSRYLQDLETSGFIEQHYTWSLKTGTLGRQKLYRLSDSYLRFYVKYIQPNLPHIKKNAYRNIPISSLPGWEAMLGFQVENLILKNRLLLLDALGVYPQDVVADNPYRQRATKRHKGCQIDYLVQLRTNTIFACEFKFTKQEIGSSVISAMQEKINRLAISRGYGICPVLVHIGGVANSVYDKQYFYRVIDAADFLTDLSEII